MKHFAGLVFKKRWLNSTLLIISCVFAGAQDIAIGTWRTHFSYQDARIIELTPEKIFCAVENGLFSYEIATGEIRRLSKIDGLSDVGISAMKYDPLNHVLIIGYRSGFVDFIYEDRILSISDIANTTLDVNKTINDITLTNGKAYLATDLGVIVANTASATVDENFVQIGSGGSTVNVLEVLISGDSIIIRTGEGIQSGNLSTNLLDFNSWTRYPATIGFTELTNVNDEIYALSSSDLMQRTNDQWEDTGVDLPVGAEKLFGIGDNLFTASEGVVYRLNLNEFLEFSQVSASSINDLNFIGSTIILADSELGLTDQNNSIFYPAGPLSDSFSNIKVIADQVYGFHAPSPLTYDGTETQPSFSVFAEGTWTNPSIDGFINVSDVVRFNGTQYFSSIGKGIYHEEGNQIMTPGNSVQDTVITSLASSDVLWVSSFGSQEPIYVLDTDDLWSSFSSITLFGNQFISIDISETGVAWLGSLAGEVTVVDDDENLFELINSSDGLPSLITDVVISVEDNAWVSTLRGPALFPSASFLGSNPSALTPSFEGRILFEDETVNAVVTDGGNRIWFGTENGVWIYDENTSEQIAVFNEQNSPLPSNRVIQMEYNGRNGEVFILTDKGMVSYRSASSIGTRLHRNVNVFPNPVRPTYQGEVGLTGLASNVNVKITDINGNLVQEVDANGGSASWDLKNIGGGAVSTGIYLFFSSTSDGEETYIGKIAVIR